MQATEIMNTEILKPEKPEFLKIDFLEEKFNNASLLSAAEALATTAEEPDERRSSFRVEVPSWGRQSKKCPTAKEGFGNIFYDEGLENGMQITAISVSLGKPFDVSTDFCQQYQFHSESITNNEKVELAKELVRMLKLEDHSNHKNWETLEANGYGNGYELRSEYVIKHVESNRNEPAGISDLLLSLVSGMEEKLRAMVTEPQPRPEGVHEPAAAVHPEVLKYGGRDTLIYNLDVSLVSDFLTSLTPDNMNVAPLGLAVTDEDDLFGDLEVFEHFVVDHTVSELKKKIKVNVKLTLPSELKKITSTFVVEGAQTMENEECEEMIKEVKELSAEGSITTEPNGNVPLQNQDESGDGDGKKEAPPGPKEPEKKYEWVDVVKKRKRPKKTDLTVISPLEIIVHSMVSCKSSSSTCYASCTSLLEQP